LIGEWIDYLDTLARETIEMTTVDLSITCVAVVTTPDVIVTTDDLDYALSLCPVATSVRVDWYADGVHMGGDEVEPDDFYWSVMADEALGVDW
jgi:hypothetical protein